MKRYLNRLNNQRGAISLEMVVTIPIVIYSLIIITGFLQVVNNYSLLSYNIANARANFNYSAIIDEDMYSFALGDFYRDIVDNLNQDVIEINYSDLTISCFTSLKDLNSSRKISYCKNMNPEEIKFFTIDINYKYSAFSSIFARYYEKSFSDMNQRVIIVNEYS